MAVWPSGLRLWHLCNEFDPKVCIIILLNNIKFDLFLDLGKNYVNDVDWDDCCKVWGNQNQSRPQRDLLQSCFVSTIIFKKRKKITLYFFENFDKKKVKTFFDCPRLILFWKIRLKKKSKSLVQMPRVSGPHAGPYQEIPLPFQDSFPHKNVINLSEKNSMKLIK